MYTAQHLFDELKSILDAHRTLDVPINVFCTGECPVGDRVEIGNIDVFLDNGDTVLHSIDINI